MTAKPMWNDAMVVRPDEPEPDMRDIKPHRPERPSQEFSPRGPDLKVSFGDLVRITWSQRKRK